MWLVKNRRLLDWTAVRFLIVGVANTFFGLMVIFLSKRLLDLGDITSNALGYCFGLLLSFLLNARWSFSFHGDAKFAIIRFTALFAVAYAMNLAMVLWLIVSLGINSYLSQTLGIIPYTAISYLGMRYWAFPVTQCAHPSRLQKGKTSL